MMTSLCQALAGRLKLFRSLRFLGPFWAAALAGLVLRAEAQAQPVVDLCASCATSENCSAGLCIGDPNHQYPNMCTQSCTADKDCPSSFTCQGLPSPGNAKVCWPSSPQVCASVYQPPKLNNQCLFADSQGNAFNRDCATGLICAPIPNTGGTGYCVEYCNANSRSGTCQAGYSCCFGLDPSSGACLPSSPGNPNGGCFQNLQVGDGCNAANARVCPGASQCLYINAATNMRCFNLCGASNSGGCSSAETCANLNGVSLCCETSQYNPSDPTSCVPAPACILELGTLCDRPSDCRTGNCLRNPQAGNQSACSISCQADSDCAASVGGGSCQSIGGHKACWPTGGPQPVPACAVATAASSGASSSSGGGGGCQAGGDSSQVLGTAWFGLGLFVWANKGRGLCFVKRLLRWQA